MEPQAKPSNLSSAYTEDDMLDKIRKLLAKAEGTNNETEANAFFGKAQELMERYAISEAEARAKGIGISQTKPMQAEIVIPKGHVTITNAHTSLIQTICRCNRVITYNYTHDPNTRVLAGYEADVRFVEMLYHSVIIQMDRAMLRVFFDEDAAKANAEQVDETYNADGTPHTPRKKSFADAKIDTSDTAKMAAIKAARKRTFRPEFIAGYVGRVEERIMGDWRLRESERDESKSLVLRDAVHNVEDWLTNDLGLRFTHAPSKKLGNFARNSFARDAGRNAANNADLGHSGLSNNTKQIN